MTNSVLYARGKERVEERAHWGRLSGRDRGGRGGSASTEESVWPGLASSIPF
jgi:hypothetical protein